MPESWQVLEFATPITESQSVEKDFFIRGVAINETTTRNNTKYVMDELEKAAPTFRDKPILLDHVSEVKNIVGRTTENVVWDAKKRAILFEAKIMDENIKERINSGLITDVSIGAIVQDLREQKDGSLLVVGMQGTEISLVAIPSDVGANISSAIQNSFQLKEQMKREEEFDIEKATAEYFGEAKEEEKEEEDKDEPIAPKSQTLVVNLDHPDLKRLRREQ